MILLPKYGRLLHPFVSTGFVAYMEHYRESVSNNRVKSGSATRPIDQVPAAGARSGTADGVESTDPGLANTDLEDGERTPGTITLQLPTLLSPQSHIPPLRV